MITFLFIFQIKEHASLANFSGLVRLEKDFFVITYAYTLEYNKINYLLSYFLGVSDLLIRIPYQEEWQGLFSVRIEAWHVQNPQSIPQLKKEKHQNDFKIRIFLKAKLL